jgi:diaminopropionate ammonia-lyase
MESIRWEINRFKKHLPYDSSGRSFKMEPPHTFHKSMPGYSMTPLKQLKNLAAHLGVQEIFVKDESYRFGLNSFKGLGSSYAIGRILAKELGCPLNSFADLKSSIKSLPKQTFASATAGNHGRGLAFAAKLLGQKAAIFLPKGSSLCRLQKLLDLGAEAKIIDLSYDDAVRYVSRLSQEMGWKLVQDTSWNDYVEVPSLIMEGYLTVVAEYLIQSEGMCLKEPTHVILQAGVGSFAAAISEGLQRCFTNPITFIVAEPAQADAFFQSACSYDGNPKRASGNLATHMAGLAAAELNPIAWEILRELSYCFLACKDSVSAKGMRILGNPLGEDPRIISGESGALPAGVLFEMCKNPALFDLKKSLGIDSDSRILMISTEGDTDHENYRAVCWEGCNSIS